MHNPFVRLITAFLLVFSSTSVITAQETVFNSINSLLEGGNSGGSNTLETTVTIVALSESYALIQDSENSFILVPYFNGFRKDDLSIGRQISKLKLKYITQSSNSLAIFGGQSSSNTVDWLTTAPVTNLPMPEELTDKTLSNPHYYVLLTGNYDERTGILTNERGSYEIKEYNGEGDNGDGSHTIVGYVTGGIFYAYQSYPKPATAKTISINLSCTPAMGGKAWIGDDESAMFTTVPAGETVSLHAKPAEGYAFTGWILDGVTVSTAADYTVTPDASCTYTAVFEETNPVYTLSIVNNTPLGGNVAIEGTTETNASFDAGTSVTVVATPAAGYEFGGWSNGHETVSTDLRYTFTLNGNTTLTALFTQMAPVSGTISEFLSGSLGKGEVKLIGEFEVVCVRNYEIFISDGETCLMCEYKKADPKPIEYMPFGSRITDVRVTLSTDNYGIKYGEMKTLPEVIAKNDNVTVVPVPVRISDATKEEYKNKYIEISNILIQRSSESGQYNMISYANDEKYATLRLTTTDALDMSVENRRWTVRGVMSVAGSVENAVPVLRSSYVKPLADVPQKVTLTVSTGTGGNVWIGTDHDTKSASFEVGTTVSIHAEAAEGYTFKEWNDGTEKVAETPDHTFAIAAETTLAAIFEPIEKPEEPTPSAGRLIKVRSADPSKGSVMIDGVECGEVTTDKAVTISAVPAGEDHFFSHWSDGTHNYTLNPFTYPDPEPLDFTAHFVSRYKVIYTEPDNATISITTAEGSPVVSGSRIEEGKTIYVVVTPAPGYDVETVSANGVAVGHSSPVTFTVSGETVISVTTTPKITGAIRLTAVSNDPQMGTVYINTPGTTSVTLRRGESATFHAEPANGCTFDGWRIVGATSIKSTQSVYTIGYQSGDVHLEAVFSHIVQTPFTVTVKSSNPAKGTVAIKEAEGNSVTTRNPVTVIARPATEHDYFVDWTDARNTVVSTSAEFTYTATQSIDLTANFRSHYPVTFTVEGHGSATLLDKTGATIASGAVVEENERVTLVLSAEPHYSIGSLSVNGTKVEPDGDSFTTAVTSPTVFAVVYEPDMHTISIEDSPHGTLEIYRGIADDGNGSGSQLCHGDRAPYATTLYIFASPADGYNLDGININGEMKLPTAGNAFVAHTLESDVTVKPVYSATGGVSGISGIFSPGSQVYAVYNLRGEFLGREIPSTPGIYIVRSGGKTVKIAVR